MYEFSPARGGFHAAVAGTRPPSGSWRRWSAPAPPSPNTATKLCAQDRPPPRTTTTLQPAKPRYPDLSPAPAVRIRASGRSAPCGLRRQRCVALRPAWCHGRWPRALFPPRVLEGERLMVEPACRPVVWSPEPWGSAADGNARSERPPDLPGWETITEVTLDVDGDQPVQAGHHRGSRPRRPASAARIARRGWRDAGGRDRLPRLDRLGAAGAGGAGG